MLLHLRMIRDLAGLQRLLLGIQILLEDNLTVPARLIIPQEVA